MHINIYGNGKWAKNHQNVLKNLEIPYEAFDLETTPEESLMKAPHPDAAIITASTVNHFTLSKFFLERNIPVFCEKPVCLEQWQLDELGKYLDNRKIFMAGHQLVFDPTVQKIAAEKNACFFSSKRTGAIPRTEGAIMSLAIHDIAIAMHLFNYEEPISIQAIGNHHCAQINIQWTQGKIADIFVQSIAPAKLRHATIVQKNPDPTLLPTINYIHPDNWNRFDLLTIELQYFITNVKEGTYPEINNLAKAISVTRIAIKARESLITSKE